MTAERWDRLAASLADAGITATVSPRPYPGGVSYSITLRRPDGHLVEIHDRWWRKNPAVWIGWQVHLEGRDSIVIRDWPVTKKRSEVVAAVKAALATSDNGRNP